MRVLVSEFSEETNSFSPVLCRRKDFSPWCSKDSKKEITGLFDVMEEAGFEPYYGPMYRAQASGKVEHYAVEEYLHDVRLSIANAGGVAAICLALHGATQSTEMDDVCGYVISTLKMEFGVPVCAAFDLHGNMTSLIVESSDGLAGYQTYPHRDAYETGRRAAELMLRKMRKEDVFVSCVRVPMIAPASGYTTDEGPVHELYERAAKLKADGQIIDYSIFQMQPWLDVMEAGSCVYIVAKDKKTSDEVSASLAKTLSTLGQYMQPAVNRYEEILSAIEEKEPFKPVVISDFSDSPNAGAVGDDVGILKYMLEHSPSAKCAFILNDTPAVNFAFELGVSGEGVFELGGTRSPIRNDHVCVKARVRSLHDGSFRLGGPMMTGFEMNIGRTAVISVGSFDILVCEQMCITGDVQLYRHFGIEPVFYDMVVVKANTSFRLPYGTFCGKILVLDTGCASTADLKSLPWERIKRNAMYPFIEIKDSYKPEEYRII